MTFKFSAEAKTWQRFFQLATIDSHLTNLAVEVKKDGLFTSTINKPYQNCWSIVKHEGFETEGEGIFVVETEEIQRVIKLMENESYTGVFEDNNLVIFSDNDRITPPLISLDIHTDESNSKSTWVPEVKAAKGKRWYRSIKIKDGIPIPMRPPDVGETKASKIYEQIISLDPDELTKSVKRARIIGEESLFIETTKKKGDINISIESKSHFKHHKEIALIDGKCKVNFTQKYSEPITKIFSLAEDNVKLAMTGLGSPVFDEGSIIDHDKTRNPGLWVAIYDDYYSACYLIQQLSEEDE